MFPVSNFSCWLIGADSLLQECGDLLLRGGHRIQGVIAPEGRVADWARARNLETLDPKSDCAQRLAAVPFDYLFAITHLAIVPERILALPARCAINFHDGPLPDYAGLNAPVWALLNRESRYGITWHVMTAALDAGDILVAKRFDIAPDETALSLHTKCFEAALASFGELVSDLAEGTVRQSSQDGLARRTFERHRRPDAACAIDWTSSADEIEALVRASSFGRYANPIGLATIRTGDQALVITSAKAGPGTLSSSRSSRDGAPGEVLAIDDEGMLVACGRGTIALQGFADLRGRAIAAREVERRLELSVGMRLDNLSPEESRRLTALNRRMSQSERHWVERLARLDPITLPCAVATAAAGSRPVANEVRLPEQIRAIGEGQPLSTVLTAAFTAYMGRLARRTSFDVGYDDLILRNETVGLEAWVATRLPLRIELREGERAGELVSRIADELVELHRRGPWLRDVLARHPSLHRVREDRPGHMLPLAIQQSARFEALSLQDGSEWTVEVSDELAACRFVHDAARISDANAGSIRRGFEAFLESLSVNPGLALDEHPLVEESERERQLFEWNETSETLPREACVHQLFEEQVQRTPDATALVFGKASLTYAQLDQRADRLAAQLRELGAAPGGLVGVCVERSLHLVVAVLGVLKSGAAYLPLDPAFPMARLTFMVEDSALGLIVTQERLVASLPSSTAQIHCIDREPTPAANHARTTNSSATPEDRAYVIYTSGSTGRPKGVEIEHRQVSNFFAAIDERIPYDPPGVWLAVTSLSFDISVLELLWTLTRGFKVVLHSAREASGGKRPLARTARRKIDFSLFYFGSDEGREGGDGYRLLLEGARFADANGFRAVWTPERHFHAFGGLYPNPALTGAAIAAITSQVEIRAGSVVLPLHHPIRVAEEWAVVDRLSNGRVAISFASGWHPGDFVLAPERHAKAKDVMFHDLEVVRRLWRGESITFPGPDGAAVDVRTLPRPVQAELPVWITSASNTATWVEAGRIGANVLSHLLGQSVEELALKIAAYRDARVAAGLDPATGIVSLMLHTFVGLDEARAKAMVQEPLERYLGSSIDLVGKYAASFPAFRAPSGESRKQDLDLSSLEPAERAALLAHARDRYYETSGLFGGPQRCSEMVEKLRAIGVDEIACLIDFGVPVDEVLRSLPQLDRVRRRAQEDSEANDEGAELSLAEAIRRESVTHLQCTPSMARMLCADEEMRVALRNVRHLFVGGEALPESLARELSSQCELVVNMYGPTETTIWSSTHQVEQSAPAAAKVAASSSTVPIGRPLPNTRFYVLDEHLRPLPIGVAGELVIGGTSVARGYLNRPELAAQRFVPDPWVEDGGARMYRTGDLVRYASEGVVEFLGRTDHQIKVRGHRIEPGEIESLLAREPSVAEALVVAREDTPGDQRLVAYIVSRDSTLDVRVLRERLAALLPEYMVPAQLAIVGEIPRTPNGKIDRGALSIPAPSQRPLADCAPPSNELESRLTELWQEVLVVDRIGVEDNFFDLGGHSLLAVRIHRRLGDMASRGELRAKQVSLTDLFRFPTIRSLARFLASEVAQGGLEEASQRGRGRRASMSRRRQGASEA
ncbi:MAG TPA: MupA/Atu3671 family FMN-dependent luciferase-like monooxygenase [Planctomycetota bacterium]|nr:MupA/Atu3671 family FMN-dependent luciferase-like monooxygenase [Planctomycetota bacterium]